MIDMGAIKNTFDAICSAFNMIGKLKIWLKVRMELKHLPLIQYIVLS